MTTAHPLRPLVLALSLRLNDPDDLQEQIEGLPPATGDATRNLSDAARKAAFGLARAAIAFNGSADVAAHASTDGFRQSMIDIGVPLMCVGTMPWPRTMARGAFDDEHRFRQACLDVATGCFALMGRVPRPDRPNLLTNLLKAIPMGLSHGDWTFYTLPDYGGTVSEPVEA